MARKFQGYARGEGIKQRDPGYGSLNRMREQGNQVIRDLKEDRAERQRLSQQNIRDLESNFRREQANTAEIFRFQQQRDENRMAADRQNARVRAQNAKTAADNASRVAQQLSALAPTLVKQVSEGVDKYKEAQEKAEFVSAVLNPDISFLPSDAYQTAEGIFEQNEEIYQSIGDSMEGAVSQGAIQEYRMDSPYQQKLSTENRVLLAIDEINGVVTTYDEAPMQVKRLMDKYDLYNVNRVKLYDFAKKVQARRASLFEAESKVRAKDLSYQRDLQRENNFVGNPTADGVSSMILTYAQGTDDGTKSRGMSVAVNKILGEDSVLANPALVNNEDFERIVNDKEWKGGQFKGQTIADRFPRLIRDLRSKRLSNFNTDAERIKKAEKAQSTARRLELRGQINAAVEAGDYNYNAYVEGIVRSDMNDDDKKLLMEYAFDVSEQGQRQEDLEAEITTKFNNGEDISYLVPQLRGAALAKWNDVVAKQREAFQEAGVPKDTDTQKFFVKTAKNVLGREATVDYDQSYVTAGNDAFYQYQARRQRNLSDGMGPLDAHKEAQEYMIKMVQSRVGMFEVELDTSAKPSKFTYYAPEGGYYKNIAQANGGYALQAVIDNDVVLDETLLVNTKQLQSIYRAIQTNTPYQKPWVIEKLEKNGRHDSLQRQMNLFANEMGLEPIQVPMNYRQYLSETSDNPRVKRFMETATSPLDYDKISLVRDPTSHRNPALMAPAVAAAYPMIEVQPAEGGLKGLTIDDYRELAFIVSAEAERDTDDEFAVAASVLNRLATGGFGKTISEIARRPGQYEAVGAGDAVYDMALAKRLASPNGQRMIAAMLKALEGRTDFKGQSQIGNRQESDPMFSERGNFYHYTGQTPGSGAYTGPINRSYERFLN